MSEVGVSVNSIRAILANAKDIGTIFQRISVDPKVVMSDTDISILSRRFVFAGDLVFEESQVSREHLEGDSWVINQEMSKICSPRCGYISWREDTGYVIAPPIVVSKDNMSAYLVVPPRRTISKPITVSILRDIYMHSGLKREYDGVMELFLLNCWERGGVFKISEGIVPTVARKRSFAFFGNVVTNEERLRSNLGRVPIIEVQEGDRIAKVTGEKESQEGVDVFGNLLSPEIIEDEDLNEGEYQVGFGCHASKDEEYLMASVTGVFIIDHEKKEYSIKDTFYLDHDVDVAYGNIQTKFSNVHITGSVQGITIKSGGNVTVLGKCEDAQINAQGSVVIKEGIEGVSRVCKIETGGSVESRFFSKVLVRGGAYVCADSYIVDSEISSEGSIVVLSEEGVILHSRLSTSAWIACQTVGSETDRTSRNIFRVGFNSEEHEVRMRMDDQVRKLQEEVQKIRSELGNSFLEDPIGSMRKLQETQQKGVRQKLGDLRKYGTKLLQLQEHRIRMDKQEFKWDEKKSGVAVFSKIYTGAFLYLEKYGPFTLKEDLAGPVYFKINVTEKETISSAPLSHFRSPADILTSK